MAYHEFDANSVVFQAVVHILTLAHGTSHTWHLLIIKDTLFVGNNVECELQELPGYHAG